MSDSANESFLNKKRFSGMIEDIVHEKNMSYMDAIIYLCEKINLEIEDCKKYTSNSIRDKLRVEAMGLNFIPKEDDEAPFE